MASQRPSTHRLRAAVARTCTHHIAVHESVCPQALLTHHVEQPERLAPISRQVACAQCMLVRGGIELQSERECLIKSLEDLCERAMWLWVSPDARTDAHVDAPLQTHAHVHAGTDADAGAHVQMNARAHAHPRPSSAPLRVPFAGIFCACFEVRLCTAAELCSRVSLALGPPPSASARMSTCSRKTMGWVLSE